MVINTSLYLYVTTHPSPTPGTGLSRRSVDPTPLIGVIILFVVYFFSCAGVLVNLVSVDWVSQPNFLHYCRTFSLCTRLQVS